MAGQANNSVIGLSGIGVSNTESTQSTATVTGTAAQVSVNNPNAISRLFINLSADNIFLLTDPSVSTINGIFLVANGGYFNTKSWEDFGLTGLPWYAVSSGISSGLMIVETTVNN
jgi:hypothetical protein